MAQGGALCDFCKSHPATTTSNLHDGSPVQFCAAQECAKAAKARAARAKRRSMHTRSEKLSTQSAQSSRTPPEKRQLLKRVELLREQRAAERLTLVRRINAGDESAATREKLKRVEADLSRISIALNKQKSAGGGGGGGLERARSAPRPRNLSVSSDAAYSSRSSSSPSQGRDPRVLSLSESHVPTTVMSDKTKPPKGQTCTGCHAPKIGGRVLDAKGQTIWYCRACMLTMKVCDLCRTTCQKIHSVVFRGQDLCVCGACKVAAVGGKQAAEPRKPRSATSAVPRLNLNGNAIPQSASPDFGRAAISSRAPKKQSLGGSSPLMRAKSGATAARASVWDGDVPPWSTFVPPTPRKDLSSFVKMRRDSENDMCAVCGGKFAFNEVSVKKMGIAQLCTMCSISSEAKRAIGI